VDSRPECWLKNVEMASAMLRRTSPTAHMSRWRSLLLQILQELVGELRDMFQLQLRQELVVLACPVLHPREANCQHQSPAFLAFRCAATGGPADGAKFVIHGFSHSVAPLSGAGMRWISSAKPGTPALLSTPASWLELRRGLLVWAACSRMTCSTVEGLRSS
jgi:hypothetical protein